MSSSPLSLDIHQYLDEYEAWGLIQRALFVARSNERVRPQAVAIALKELKSKTYDFELYKSIRDEFASSVSELEAEDTAWIESVTYNRKQRLDALISNLKSYKMNLIRESIRMGQLDLARFFLDIGQFENALRAFAKVREYCVAPEQMAYLSLDLMRVSLYLENYSHVLAFGSRAKSTMETAPEIKSAVYAYCGLAHMCLGEYKHALDNFMHVNSDLKECILTKADHATYMSLCCMACFTAEELKCTLNDLDQAAKFAEIDPLLKQCMQAMNTRRYSHMRDILNSNLPLYSIDPFLAPQLPTIMPLIHQNVIMQFLFPYSDIQLKRISEETSIPVAEVDNCLTKLMENGLLDLQLDSMNKTVHRRGKLTEEERTHEMEDLVSEALLTAKILHLQAAATRAGVRATENPTLIP